MHAFKNIKMHLHQRQDEEKLLSKIMPSVWGMHKRPRSTAYVNQAHLHHYEDLLNNSALNDGERVALQNSDDVVNLINELSTHQLSSLEDVEQAVSARAWPWITGTNDETLENVVELAVRLWLFTKPVLKDKTTTLQDAVRGGLPAAKTVLASDLTYLNNDFSAKTLTRVGGITLLWTSCLNEHLTFVEKSHLRVFRHVSTLYHYRDSSIGTIYPDNFLQETVNTIRLLFPGGRKSEKRRRKICKAENVDIEAQMAKLDTFDLNKFPIWRHRLANIQKVLDTSRPRTMKQWWFDRRKRHEWGTFWVALVVFALTLVFGIISSVTGIMQVYAASR